MSAVAHRQDAQPRANFDGPNGSSKETMQVLLQADKNIEGGHLMAEHLQTVVTDALGRFGERITRVEAHLSDVDGRAKPGADSIHCMLEARLTDLDAVVVTEHGPNAHQAIEGGVRKLKRAVGAAIGKHDPRRRQARSEAGLPDDAPPASAQPGDATAPL